MKISISGKGGTGKTTIAGTLARLLARQGQAVLAIDGDSNPNLALTLGIPPEESNAVPALPPEILADVVDEDGNNTRVLTVGLEEIAARYGVPTADGIRLLTMKRIDHAGKG
jgi:CO dehydrogenase maturation factor